MIVDTLENLQQYAALNPLIGVVVDYLHHHDLAAMEPGIHPIQGDQVYVNVQMAPAKERDEARFETHRRMIDIQIPISDAEEHGWCPRVALPAADYDAQTDMTLHDPQAPATPGSVAQMYYTLQPGQFAMYLPQDGHAPAITAQDMKKAIFKVAVHPTI